MTPVLIFTLQACDGPCLANAVARKRLGVEVGDALRIESDHGVIFRFVHKIPEQIIPVSSPTWIWINEEDFAFLGVIPGDQVAVSKSDSLVECP